MLDNPRRILAIKLADLGDLLLTEPALRSLQTRYPDASIDVLTTPAAAELVSLFGDEYGCVTFNKADFDKTSALTGPTAAVHLARFAVTLRRRRYDAVAIFHHLTTQAGALKFRGLSSATASPVVAGLDNGRGTFLTHRATDLGFGARHEVEYMLEVSHSIGGADVNPAPALSGASQIPSTAHDLPERYAAVVPTTGPYAPGRNWPADSFARLARLLLEEGLKPVILGTPDATPAARQILESVADAIDLVGQTRLRDLVAVVNSAEVVITGDSFPGHLARALDRPVVSIFGPSNHLAWKPYGAVDTDASARAIVVRHDVPCSPCLYTGYRLGRRHGCPVRTCLLEINPEMVMSAVHAATGVSQ